MSNITESIFDNGEIIIPMADVSFIQRTTHPTIGANGIFVILKHTRWDMDADTWANPAYISEKKSQAFISAWCVYRSELEFDTPTKQQEG